MVGVATSDDGVRYARVGDLRAKGFEVTHTPSKRNKDHTSISPSHLEMVASRENPGWVQVVAG